jgi:hypothetical protein
VGRRWELDPVVLRHRDEVRRQRRDLLLLDVGSGEPGAACSSVAMR